MTMLKSPQGAADGRRAPHRLLDKLVAALAASALAFSLGFAAVTPAAADSAPPEPASPATPATVTADALPTVQIDGVVWQQVVVGNTVYAAGSFGTARPAGSPAGSNTVVRRNILAYNLTTGELLPFAPALNAQAYSIAASPDGSRIYVGGDFTSVNGTSVWRVAALDPGTGALIPSFLPKVAASVRAIVPTAGTVYLGGLFTAVGSVARSRLAAFQAANGALTAWAPSAEAGRVNALALSPDGTRMVVGGAFTTLNGSANPGYGLAAVDTVNGGLLPWAVNDRVRDAGVNSAITSLSGDADNVYATGYVFGTGGNLEGTVAAGWNGGPITWLEDCHGDTYAVYPAADVVYKVGHAHYCGNVGGYPQTEPWGFQRALAFSKSATGTINRDPLGYPNWAGLPSPSLLNWFPTLDTGTYTGQNQGAWAVTGNGQYVVLGGEFTTVNGTRQQGLVRFAVRDLAPNTRGPVLSGARSIPTLSSPAAGTVRIRWQANYDQDNVRLTYRVIRDGVTAVPAYTVTQDSTFWQRPGMSYLDSGLVPGQTYRYRIFVTDPLGNESRSDTVSITAAASTPASGYADAVQADHPGNFWRFNDATGPTLVDSAGAEDLAAGTGAGLRADGAVAEATGAGTFDGTVNGVAADTGFQRAPDVFTAEAWVRTATTAGGKIIGFGNVASGTSRVTDRNVYMDDAGRIYFGLWNGAVRTVNSGTGFNDGQWHQVIATLSGGGMFLYIDGARAAFRTDVTSGRVFDGYWRIGSDLAGTWPSQPSSGSLKGDIDEVALYPAALGLQQVQTHYRASGRTLATPATPPTAAFASSITYLTLSVDASGSSDPNGPLASYSWAYGDGSTGTGVTTQHVYAAAGSYTVRLTVTDGDGNSASTTRTVTATAPPGNQPPVAAFTSTTSQLTATVDASTSTDPDGTVASYAWDFGDSTTGTGKTASHAYAGGGTYTITLTVTDNIGAVSTSTAQVSVQPNQPPSAQFTATVSNLTAAFDAGASTDPDGSVASYAWDFGDASAGTGATPSHTYAAAGNYAVSLTVLDNNGAAGTFTKTVTVTAPPPNSVIAADAFGRTTAQGWGTADTGGAWTVNGTAGNFAVGSGVGSMTLATAGVQRLAYLAGVSAPAADLQVKASTDKIASGGGMFLGIIGRKAGADEYRAKLKISSTGSTTLYLTKLVGGAETTLQSVTVPGLTVAAGDQLRLRMTVTGTAPAALQAKAWRDGATEPATWLVTAGDASASLQTAGSVGLMSFLWSTAANAPVQATFDEFNVRLN
ncbi:PKD domain-containing protein [Arthrobacter sp. TE12232]